MPQCSLQCASFVVVVWELAVTSVYRNERVWEATKETCRIFKGRKTEEEMI